MILLYSDKELTTLVTGEILYEGFTYYLNIESYSKVLIDQWLTEEYILNAISNYHSRNKILAIRFDILVGFVNILGTTYDIRSRKLQDGESGNRQFQQLLDEINDISNRLTFNFKGTSYSHRKTEYEYNQNLLEIFDYYYQLVFTFPAAVNLETLLNQCFKQPHTASQEITKSVGLSRSKKTAPIFYGRLGRTSSWGNIPSTHHLAHSAMAKKTHEKTGRHLLPLTVPNQQYISTTNTIENRFLKFFLEDIHAICLRVLNSNFDSDIKNKAARLETRIHVFLRHTFFKDIQRLNFVPSSSSVLLKKSGYKEIYFHFVQSKFSFRPILEDLHQQAPRAGLKNVATLYEIWVFFKIADLLFEREIIQETFNGRLLKNGSLVGAYTWNSKHFQLSFNQSYTQNNNGSYSVTLRPDISLKRDDQLYLFDAKYKYNSKADEEDKFMRIVKPEDIHKMHAYVDAIPAARTAIVLYPGTEYIFYDKLPDGRNEHVNLNTSKGVGAIPLLPGNSEMLSMILETLK